MRIIKELGSFPDSIDKRTGKPNMKKKYLYECPVCLSQIPRFGKTGLKSKTCKSCRKSTLSHGMSDTRLYHIFQAMHQRCYNPNTIGYHRYGGRGITVCDRWQTFDNFYEDNISAYNEELTIDRIDGDGSYCPSNVQWISKAINSAKTCRTRQVIGIKDNIETAYVSIAEASRITGLPKNNILMSLKLNRPNRKGFLWVYM